MLKKRLKPILSIEGIIEGSLARGNGGSFAGAAGTHRPTGGFVPNRGETEKRRDAEKTLRFGFKILSLAVLRVSPLPPLLRGQSSRAKGSLRGAWRGAMATHSRALRGRIALPEDSSEPRRSGGTRRTEGRGEYS
jgi:hypothetical protein